MSAPAGGTAGTAISSGSISSTLSGATSGASGTITFTVFGPMSSPPSGCSSGGTVVGTVSVSGNGTYHPSSGYTPSEVGTYYWLAGYSGDNANAPSGSDCGAGMTSTVVSAAPAASTGSAQNVAPESATLTGTVNPNDAATTYHFEFGTSTAYGSKPPAQSAGSGTSDQSASASISGLAPNTTYHFRIVATNADGTTNGADQTFTTQAVPPTVTTGSSSNVTSSSATLSGSVNPENSATTYHFEYGTTTSYGTVTDSRTAGPGTTPVAVAAAVNGLSPRTVYHYRIVATSASGTTTGADQTFTTAQAPVPPRREARLHLSRLAARTPQRGCYPELNWARTASASRRGCSHTRMRFAGTIDQHADGQQITITLRAQINHRRITIHQHARVADGRFTLTIVIPSRNTDDFSDPRHNTAGDPWTYRIAYPGSTSLLPATIHGKFRIESEPR